MIRIVCPHCHAPLSSAELEQVTCNGQLSLVCPECSVVLVSDQQADREAHSLDEHCADAPMGLAVCVGIGPTKTLAKLANHAAKKNLAGAEGVCDFTTMNESELSRLFASIDVGEVWGVGRKITAQLEAMGIHSVQQLRDSDAETIRSQFSVVLERTVRELCGVSCLELQEVASEKQQIMSSRSFGHLV